MGLRKKLFTAGTVAWSFAKGRLLAGDLASLRAYCMFIGYPRSGHSLVGALLNAHPNIVVAHELSALEYLKYGPTQGSLAALLLKRDREFAAGGRRWVGYDYAVPGQWQGRYTTLEVVGDKKGGRSTTVLARNPDLLATLRRTVGVPLRVIHHVRNPYDNISTWARKSNRRLPDAADQYFKYATVNRDLLARHLGVDEQIESHHDDLIADPVTELARLVAFLGPAAGDDYLRACAAVVFDKSSRTRDDADWPPGLIDDIAARMAGFDFLRRYRFDDRPARRNTIRYDTETE